MPNHGMFRLRQSSSFLGPITTLYLHILLLLIFQNPFVIGIFLVILQSRILESALGVLFYPLLTVELSILWVWFPEVSKSFILIYSLIHNSCLSSLTMMCRLINGLLSFFNKACSFLQIIPILLGDGLLLSPTRQNLLRFLLATPYFPPFIGLLDGYKLVFRIFLNLLSFSYSFLVNRMHAYSSMIRKIIAFPSFHTQFNHSYFFPTFYS